MSDRAFALFYNLPVFALGLWWLAARIRNRCELTFLGAATDLLVVAAGFSRFLGASIPTSGHALFLSYGLLTVANKPYRICALIFLAVTVGLKLSWGDCSTWFYGIVFGAGLALLNRSLARRKIGGDSVAK
ncbi:MAG: hypothetical protein ACKVZH_18925 [Blastocatellia bacterium]|jgi:hypothetical protein